MLKIDLRELQKYTVMLILVVLMTLFAFASPYFLTLRNLTNIVTQNTYFIIAAVGMSFVMIGGGIDLSVGYQMSLVGVVTAMSMVIYQRPVWLSILIGIVLGTLLGLFNGVIVAKVRVFPLIVTIATSTVFQGISYIVSKANTFRNYPAEFLLITTGKFLNVPYDVWLTLLVVLFAGFVYAKTSFGWNVLALGGNEEAARLAGIKTTALKISVYAICGFFVALATLVMIAKANTTSSMFGPGTEFTCLTAAIVGGISFIGGEGNMLGLVTGVFILAVLGNGMQLAGLGTYAQYIVKGLILLGAVTFDEYQKSQRGKGHKPVPAA
ncbi:MAG TPA: ABC transporter permease [Anaerolineae bacterium]|nr:ABC transporter permease [Anaerolineae bacterium]HQI85612.1 ABC transporter permease [Anaerolineae bacterium]